MTDIPMGSPLPDGVDQDVILSVTTGHGPVLQHTLITAALLARAGQDLLPFIYRDPHDPEDPDRPRPLRRARLVVVDDGLVPDQWQLAP
jgi:hypothetical protein